MQKNISTFIVNPYFSKICFIVLIIVILTIICLGVYTLRKSPYTGLNLVVDNNEWIVNRKDINNSSAPANIFVGDRVKHINNIIIEKNDFIRFPEFFSRKSEKKWWHKQKSIFRHLQSNNSVNLGVIRNYDKEAVIKINVLQGMPLSQIIKRTVLIYVSSIFFVIIGWISFSRRYLSQLNLLCSFFSCFGALYLASVAPVANRDLSIAPLLFQVFLIGSFIGAGGLITLVHFSLIYPKHKLIVKSHPIIIYSLYIYFFLSVTLYLSGLCAFGTFFPFFIIWTSIMIYSFFHSWIKEKDAILKKQIGISLITPVTCSFVFIFFNLLPTFLGLPPLDFNYFAVISLILPFTLFFVIENYNIYNEKILNEREMQEERENIIEELHDNICNDLTNIKIFSEVISKYLGCDPSKANKYVSYIKDTSKNSIEQIRDFLFSFDAKHRTWNDFISQFKEYSSIILQSKDISLDFHFSMNGAVSNPRSSLKFNIYRIYKEAIANIIKHSNAETVNITITIGENEVVMEIKDNGIGFDINSKLDKGHYGIKNMQKRTKLLNGTFNLNNTIIGKGAVIKLQIPIG